jgi:DNA replication protein DnaC
MSEKIIDTANYTHLYKIVLVGDAGVGKTHLLSIYFNNLKKRSNFLEDSLNLNLHLNY